MKLTRRLFLASAMASGLSACNLPRGGPTPRDEGLIIALGDTIAALSPAVSKEEAARAARVTYEETHRLALAYQITDLPLVHNAKVNAGLRPRGLCWHWAEDLQKRLATEGFQTLDLHRAIANGDNRLIIDHSTLIVSAKGADMMDGLVLDPWRGAGVLYWGPVRSDPHYKWEPREEVLRRNGRVRYVRAGMTDA